MESHLDIKRAGRSLPFRRGGDIILIVLFLENMQRMFHKWLNAARARRHKRVLLREKQTEFDRVSMQVAWDRWRENYMEEKLRPIVSS